MGILKELKDEIKANADGLISDVGDDVREIATGQSMNVHEKDGRWQAVLQKRGGGQKSPPGSLQSFGQSFLSGYQQSRRTGMQIQSGRVLPRVPHLAGSEKDAGMCDFGY